MVYKNANKTPFDFNNYARGVFRRKVGAICCRVGITMFYIVSLIFNIIAIQAWATQTTIHSILGLLFCLSVMIACILVSIGLSMRL